METLFIELKTALQAGSVLSWILAILLAYAGGVLSSFTPCVYPLIPITIGLIGGRSNRLVKTGLVLSISYVFGMATVFSVLGVLASLSGHVFGSFTNSPTWYWIIGIIMIFCSLWLMDIFVFDPNAIFYRLKSVFFKTHHKRHSHPHTHKKETDLLAAFFMGATSGLIASPCTTPVLTVILTFIATEKSVLFGTLLMMAFAFGLGTILILIGTFTGAVRVLPKSGKWLNAMKVFSGLLVLGIAAYFIYKAGTLSS